MKRRDFICGASCFLAGFALSKFTNNNHSIENNSQLLKRKFNEIYIEATSHCNLNCKGCDAYSPLSKKEFVTYNDLVRDFTKLKEIYNDKYLEMLFMGGEPLLNPELSKMIEFLSELYPRGQKDIMTNGILLSSMDKNFWKTLQKNKVRLRITKYPINLDIDEIEKLANKYDVFVKYEPIYSDKIYDLKTHNIIKNNVTPEEGHIMWGKHTFDISGKQDWVVKGYTCCHINNASAYIRGNLYFCLVHAHMNSLIEYFKLNIKISENEYLRMADIKNLKEIETFISSPNSLCRFCKQCHSSCFDGKDLGWDFSKREISEWT